MGMRPALTEKMPHQRDLFPPEASEFDGSHSPASERRSDPPVPLWYQRVSLAILVVFCFYVGVLVVLLPWTRYWQENHYLLTSPVLGPVLNSGITRGAISGLGLLDIWIGISEIIQYHDQRS